VGSGVLGAGPIQAGLGGRGRGLPLSRDAPAEREGCGHSTWSGLRVVVTRWLPATRVRKAVASVYRPRTLRRLSRVRSTMRPSLRAHSAPRRTPDSALCGTTCRRLATPAMLRVSRRPGVTFCQIKTYAFRPRALQRPFSARAKGPKTPQNAARSGPSCCRLTTRARSHQGGIVAMVSVASVR